MSSERFKYWAEERWWTDPANLKHFRCTAAEADRYMTLLELHFNREWWADVMERDRPNTIAAEMLGGGLKPWGFLLGLGRDLAAIAGAEGFNRKIVDLKGDKSVSAQMECETAAILAHAGLPISFPAERGRSPVPDILVSSAGDEVAIECKRLDREEWEWWTDGLMMRLIQSMPPRPDGVEVDTQVSFNPRLSEIRLPDKDFAEFNEIVAETIVVRVQSALVDLCRSNRPLPLEAEVPGVARIRVAQRGEQSDTWVQGFEVSTVAKTRRLISNGFVRALRQIPPGTPGVIVVRSDNVPDPAIARLSFDSLMALPKIVVDGQEVSPRCTRALVLVSTRYLGSGSPPVFLLENHECPGGGLADRVVSTFRHALNAVMV